MKFFSKINYFFLSKTKIININKIIFFSIFSFLLYINSIKIFIIIPKNNEGSQTKTINLKKTNNLDYLKLFDIKYLYSFKFNIIKVEYNIEFHENNNNNLIVPSDLTLYQNLHIFCHIGLNNSNIIINSFPDIIENKYFKCIEYFNIYENIKFGIKLYEMNEKEEEINNQIIYFFSEELFNYLNLYNKNDKIFDPLIINKKYLFKTTKNINDNLKLKKTYTQVPKFLLKRDLIINDNEWNFYNLFKEYFCFCKDLNFKKLKNSQSCKYYFYLNLIDKNREVYIKTDYLFIDFIFNDLSSDDTFPIFKEMINEKMPAHYLTESSNIYEQYCSNINKCQTILLVNMLNYTINGDFLEKYLTLFLKLKQVISGSGTYFSYINDLFYDIEYITYISVTHGVCYFKYFLYEKNKCYGTNRIDKVLIPPSEKVLSFAMKYGWKRKDIIKLNLPKWDKYNDKSNTKYNLSNIKYNNNNSILIMFTWREVIRNKPISSHYFKNIFNLISHDTLKRELKERNITLYFALHHKVYVNYKYKIEGIKYAKFIEVKNIVDYIEKSNLFITDFSSIVFDYIYQRKPIIIYIPDYNDTLININYKKNYYELIQLMKNGTIKFENQFFNIDSVINKIIFYLKNNFKLDEKLEIFYDSLNLVQNNNIYEFIKYIKNIN